MERRVRKLEANLDKSQSNILNLQKKVFSNKYREQIKWSTDEIRLRKCLVKPDLKKATVLTDSTWRYVWIYLKQNRCESALYYWEQAENFYKASISLPIDARPLTLYYCYLNAVKALLKSKSISFDTKHGVSGERIKGRINIINEKIKLKEKGVLSGLSNYLKEPVPEGGEDYELKDILYNLAYIHRSFCLTFPRSTELYIPIKTPTFVQDKSRKIGWVEFELCDYFKSNTIINNLEGYSEDRFYNDKGKRVLRRNKTFKWEAPRNSPTQKSINNLYSYYEKVRPDFQYIYSPNRLWYLKRKNIRHEINRNPLVLTYAAMHRLSELARYEPKILSQHLERRSSWLISEYIDRSVDQFIDGISSEITKDEFKIAGTRN
ncbi:hypothetical protein EXM22_01885 [Oceanispirochaeta crateris]|uniref:Uncharacterized protein n=1 Tax=Oceanispirochaeta crateris TaxID=2518645 RepID=A0A5C1QIF6_9SPIO|nr:YaaC family protein [Oceanispirochaeta crateris]QEN06800.1 hypothetical protein EXM22_01885 [Oceanispirochaeta crateris]